MILYMMKKRIYIFIVLTFVFFSVLMIRVGYISFYMSKNINQLAYDLWDRQIPTNSGRGKIYDRNGNLIVGNELCLLVASINSQIKDKDYVALNLSKILECSYESIYKHITKKNSVELIKPEGRKININQARDIANLNMEGIYLVSDTKRYYPYGNSLSQVLGFVGVDNKGLSGIEYMYDDYLKSKSGALSIYTDAKGNIMPDIKSYYETSTKGFDLYLTIDINIQKILDNIIINSVDLYNPNQVMGLVMNVKTGEVLAMSSYPSFDLNNYQDYDPKIYNRNLPIFYAFEPGSTFKICTYAAGLEEGVFDINDSFYCSGYKIVGDRRIKDWKSGGHGRESYLNVIENSCNPGFMTIGEKLGVDKFYKYLKNFGFGEKTGIDLIGESKGILFDKNNMGPVELATSSFGQGNSVTPIQLCMMASCAVNGGKLMTPYVLKYIENTTGDIVYEKSPKVKRKVISEKTSEIIKYALESVVARGTGRNAYIEGYRVGGKTGTAQVISSTGGYESGHYILSFLGMAPMNDPDILCYLAIDKPNNCVQYGGTVAAPLVGEIMEQSLTYLGIERDYENQIEKNLRWFLDTPTYKVDNYIGKTKKEIKNTQFYNYVYYGDGDTVIYQSPDQGEKIKEGDTIMLYMG